MRSIGQLPDARQARVFHDFLVAQGIPNEVERETDGSWSVWIRDDDHLPTSQTWLARFMANPDGAEFSDAAAAAMKVRQAEAQSLEDYHKRIRTRRSLFPKLGGYGVGFLTYALIVACAAVAIYTKLGYDREALSHLFITDPEMLTMRDRSLHEVAQGEVWRLFTPMFIHFGPIHFIFNMLWLYQLGSMIEGRQSTMRLLLVVVITALVSNLAQYYVTGRPTFGGMSGVVYGLMGYIWIRGKFDRESGLFLDTQTVIYLLVWLVVCFTGMMGPVGNTAHLVGLLSGMSMGWISARFRSRKPQ
jgi:rhomboid protease GlpG